MQAHRSISFEFLFLTTQCRTAWTIKAVWSTLLIILKNSAITSSTATTFLSSDIDVCVWHTLIRRQTLNSFLKAQVEDTIFGYYVHLCTISFVWKSCAIRVGRFGIWHTFKCFFQLNFLTSLLAKLPSWKEKYLSG